LLPLLFPIEAAAAGPGLLCRKGEGLGLGQGFPVRPQQSREEEAAAERRRGRRK